MKGEVRIRPATAADDQELGELLVKSFVETYARKMPEVVVSESRKADLRDVKRKRESPQAAVIVAECEGRVAGSVTIFQPGEPHSKAWTPDTAEIRFMAVHPDFHGSGISTLLLDDAKRVARQWGARAIALHVRRGADGVARTYLQHGWVRKPEGDADLLPEIFLEAYLLQL